jgi:ubiquinone/menaquinone biosynthesis C-methylase UbiE
MDFTKEQFINFWGNTGYYEEFTYGIGIQEVINRIIYPFGGVETCLEIGCGGGVFTKVLSNTFSKVIGIDVIPLHAGVIYHNLEYKELDNQDYKCTGVDDNSIDFVFSYGVFCHFSNDAIKEYLQSIYRVMKKGGDCVIMISNFDKLKAEFPDYDDWSKYNLGDRMLIGHFYQNDSTVDIMKHKFKIVSRNLTPDHRDIVVHLKK